jgi:hypothetical protein
MEENKARARKNSPWRFLLSQFSGGIKVDLGASDPIEICGST